MSSSGSNGLLPTLRTQHCGSALVIIHRDLVQERSTDSSNYIANMGDIMKWQAALAENPKDIHAWSWLAYLGGGEFEGKQYDQRDCYLTALSIDRNTAGTWGNLGVIGGGEFEGMCYSDVQCYRKAMESDPKILLVYASLPSGHRVKFVPDGTYDENSSVVVSFPGKYGKVWDLFLVVLSCIQSACRTPLFGLC